MVSFPIVRISGPNRVVELSEVLTKLEHLFAKQTDYLGKLPDQYLIDALKAFRISAFASCGTGDQYLQIENAFWEDEFSALAIMSMRGDLKNVSDGSSIPQELRGRTLYIQYEWANDFLSRMRLHLSERVRQNKPRYGRKIIDMAYAIIEEHEGLSETFTKAQVVRLLRAQPFAFETRPADSTLDKAIDKAADKWLSRNG